jgi:hypothetical protein
MTKIYDQHKAAFANVSAYVIMIGDRRVATVAFKFGNAVTAYVHWIGSEMVRGRAGGGGYDRQSAAVSDAARKIKDDITGRAGDAQARCEFIDAAGKDGGATWVRSLELAGFTVIQAV